MISQQLLDMLVCPEDRSPLELADQKLVDSLNRAVRAGKLRNRAGRLIDTVIDGALVRQDGALAYLIVDSIPVMLMDEAAPLDQLSQEPTAD